MALIYSSKNFIVESVEKPHIDREDGGHIKIYPKVRVLDRQHLSPKEAIEAMRLTTIVGQAMIKVMNKNGVDIGRINYQDNGNWTVFKPDGSYFHIHLYGRAKSAKYQKYGQACHFPHRDEALEYYSRFRPLNSKDVDGIRKEILKLLKQKKFSDSEWGFHVKRKD